MNVVLILSDQHNPDFSGCYGGTTRTPNIDRLAAEGVRFQNAYCNNPLCVPSRASFFTGRYVHETGNWDNTNPLDGSLPNWGRYFQERGVLMAATGKLDYKAGVDLGIEELMTVKLRSSLAVTDLYRGGPMAYRSTFMKSHWQPILMDELGEDDEKRLEAEVVTSEALTWLNRRRKDDRPWVLSINQRWPHPKWRPRRDLYQKYLGEATPLSAKYLLPFDALHESEKSTSYWCCGYRGEDSDILKSQAAYQATIEELDGHIGRILTGLEEENLLDDTLVVYASDHGEMARAHGCWGKVSLHEDSIRIPLIMRGPGIPAGRVVDGPVSLLDLYPTVAAALGLAHPAFARGTPLQDAATMSEEAYDTTFPGRAGSSTAYVFSETHSGPRSTGSFAVIKERWKLVENVGYDPMLFNLAEDPDELHDLYRGESTGTLEQEKLTELRSVLSSVCSPEAVDSRARQDQQALLKTLAESGRLQKELVARGFKPVVDRLVLADEGPA